MMQEICEEKYHFGAKSPLGFLDDVSTAKEHGGLGFKKQRLMNMDVIKPQDFIIT